MDVDPLVQIVSGNSKVATIVSHDDVTSEMAPLR